MTTKNVTLALFVIALAIAVPACDCLPEVGEVAYEDSPYYHESIIIRICSPAGVSRDYHVSRWFMDIVEETDEIVYRCKDFYDGSDLDITVPDGWSVVIDTASPHRF